MNMDDSVHCWSWFNAWAGWTVRGALHIGVSNLWGFDVFIARVQRWPFFMLYTVHPVQVSLWIRVWGTHTLVLCLVQKCSESFQAQDPFWLHIIVKADNASPLCSGDCSICCIFRFLWLPQLFKMVPAFTLRYKGEIPFLHHQHHCPVYLAETCSTITASMQKKIHVFSGALTILVVAVELVSPRTCSTLNALMTASDWWIHPTWEHQSVLGSEVDSHDSSVVSLVNVVPANRIWPKFLVVHQTEFLSLWSTQMPS